MFSPAQEQQIYRTSRYLLGLLQPRLDRACRLQVRTWLAEALEQGAFVSEAEEIHTIPNFIVQLEVACLIHRELGLNVHSILAVLLYIPFSAGRISPNEIKSVCGEEVLRLLQLLVRTSELYMRKEAISSENFHNLLISMAEDMRVVLIIIAYRLYLLRHASMIRRAEDRKELASEVSFLYAPIAHRLGLYKIKGEMEDLCLMYLQPKIYGFITRKLRETKDARDAYIAEFIRIVRETLLRDLQDVSFEMKGRVKSVSSISNQLKKLPQGATLLDFAFTIHSRVGARAISGKVNGKNVSLRHQLKNGDNVEILTSPQQSPKPGWLSIVVSPKAKAKIRQLLRAEEEAGIGVAKEMIQRRIKNRKLPFDEAAFIRITLRKGYKTLSDFYRDLTHSKVDVQEFLNLYEQELAAVSLIEAQPSIGSARSAEDFTYQESESESNQINTSEVLILDRGLTGVAYSLAQCCRPLYGDEVFGLVTTRGIKVHRMNCPNAPDMFAHSPHKIICAKWNGESGSSQVASIEVVGRDELSIATNITSLIRKESGVKLRSYSIQSKDGLFHGSFVLYVERREALTVLLKKIRSASGVKHAELASRL